MTASRSALALLGLLALGVAGGTGWFLLVHGEEPGPAVGPPPPSPPPDPREVPNTSPLPVHRDAGSKAELEEGDPDDDDREPSGVEGGFTPEEILAAVAKGDWLEVERMLSVGGSDDPRVVEAVLGGLSDDRWRFKVAELTKSLKDPRLADRLLEIARAADGNEFTRSAALKAVAAVGGTGVVEAVAAILREAKPGTLLANNAALALGTLGTPEAAGILLDGLRAAAGKPGGAAFLEGIGRIRDPDTLARLSEVLQDESGSPAFRGALAEALGRTKDPAVVNEIVKAARAAEDEGLRNSCYRALALSGTPEAARELLNVLQGAENDRRLEAARALSESTSKAVAPLIEEALRTPMEPFLRSSLVAALGRTGGASSVEILGKLVADESEDLGLRGAAAKSLAQIGEGAASPVVLDVLERTPRSRENAGLRSRLLEALASTARTEDLARVEKALAEAPQETPDWFVLRQVAERLRRAQGAGK